MKNKPKILVHLHLYYHNQLNFMLKKLSNVCNCDWDLYVTTCEINDKICRRIKKLKPDANIVLVKNIGYDIWPFIQILNKINLSDYDFVLKLHTKNYRKTNQYFGKGYSWRDYLIYPLLSNKKTFSDNINLLMSDKTIGLLASETILTQMNSEYSEDNELFEEVCQKYNLKVTKGNFVAGTMFIIKAKCLEVIKNLNLSENDFPDKQCTKGMQTIAHVIERLFARIVEMENLKIYPLTDKKYRQKALVKEILQSIFAIRNKIINNKKCKEICLLGLKFYLK